MSDWPQLEQRLLESARARSRRRRVPRLRLLAPLVASLAIAVIVVVASRSPQSGVIPADERAVPTQQAAHTLERDYGVFRRSTTSADALPLTAKQRTAMERGCTGSTGSPMCWHPETARLVHRDGDERFYLLQGRTRDELCLVGFIGHRGAGGSCTVANGDRLAKPMGSYGMPGKGRPGAGYTVFPDGVTRVAYTFVDGTTASHGVKRNFAYVSSMAAITSLSWIVDGKRYVQIVADGPDGPDDRTAAQSCPRLDPLPGSPEPGAIQAARAAAAVLEGVRPQAITGASTRPATTTDVGDIRERACGDWIDGRSLVVALTIAGRPGSELLVGFLDGAPIVWSQLR